MTVVAGDGGSSPRAAFAVRPTSLAIGISFVILVLFVICFPKGGVKPGGVPLTWGYILLGTLGFAALATISAPPRRALTALLMSLPFQAIIVPLCLFNAVDRGFSGLGYIISTALNFSVFPFIFYAGFSGKLPKLSPRLFTVTLKWAIRFIAAYGIFLFAMKIGTGKFIEIPLLTVNVGDVGQLEDKAIMRGDGVAKLISTYNNGNIYGVCFAMLLPLYLVFEKNKLFVLIAWLSLLLTISRTAWFGGLFLVALLYFIGEKPSLMKMLQGIVLVAIGTAVIAWLIDLIGRDSTDFLLDPTLGNRTQKYDHLTGGVPIIPRGWVGGFGEIPYLGVLNTYGVVGLITFLPLIFGPVFLSRSGPDAKNPIRRAGRIGLYAYLFMSLSDGAILLIPVMAIFYFVALMAMEGQVLGLDPRRPVRRPPAAPVTPQKRTVAPYRHRITPAPYRPSPRR